MTRRDIAWLVIALIAAVFFGLFVHGPYDEAAKRGCFSNEGTNCAGTTH